jgi:hypothetical protein
MTSDDPQPADTRTVTIRKICPICLQEMEIICSAGLGFSHDGGSHGIECPHCDARLRPSLPGDPVDVVQIGESVRHHMWRHHANNWVAVVSPLEPSGWSARTFRSSDPDDPDTLATARAATLQEAQEFADDRVPEHNCLCEGWTILSKLPEV